MADDAGHSAIGVIGTNVAENHAFVYLSRELHRCGVDVPRVYGVSADGLHYLQEDLGDVSLFSRLGSEDGERLVKEAIKSLAHLQCRCEPDWEQPFLEKPFSRRQIFRDLNYFKYEFLKPAGIECDEDRLEDDFESLASELMSTPKELWGFLYRDCQSRNVMIHEERPYWIDFQAGRYGPIVYDIVSLLWQAKAGFSSEFREECLRLYRDEVARYREIPAIDFERLVKAFALLRTLQVLGAYGFRGLVEHKAHFLTSIPGALRNLSELCGGSLGEDYKTIAEAAHQLCELKRFKPVEPAGEGVLNVEVFSFSYKKGYPEDLSGNGGGFMFDCRGLHNPGRYEEYKRLTGRDAPVKEFLEQRGEIQPFLEHALQLTDTTVARYVARGFSNIQIGFGCTGGQHRSVYSAEHTARHIADKFGAKVRVHLRHLEQGIDCFVKADE